MIDDLDTWSNALVYIKNKILIIVSHPKIYMTTLTFVSVNMKKIYFKLML